MWRRDVEVWLSRKWGGGLWGIKGVFTLTLLTTSHHCCFSPSTVAWYSSGKVSWYFLAWKDSSFKGYNYCPSNVPRYLRSVS